MVRFLRVRSVPIMRVAIVEVRSSTVRSVVAETTVGGHRRVMDRTVGVGLSHALGAPADAPAVDGTADVLRETVRRLHEAHRRMGVLSVAMHVDPALVADPVVGRLVEEAATTLGAARLPETSTHEAAALDRAVAARGVVTDGHTLLVELDRTVLRVALVIDRRVAAVHRTTVRDLRDLAVAVRGEERDDWLELAVAVVTPMLADLPDLSAIRPRVVIAGPPAIALGRVVASQRWRRSLRAADRVPVGVADLLAVIRGQGLDADLRGAGTVASDLPLAAGAAVVTAGLLTVTGTEWVEVTDADRTEGYLLDLLGPAGPRRLATCLLEVVGEPTPHARQVARLAVELFDGLGPALGLDAQDRDVLAAAALVHDIARAEGPGHHRRGGDRVLGLPIRGVPPATLIEVASLVRSQRGRPPGSHVPAFLRLSPPRRRVVEQLVALLRLAIGLDEGDDGCVFRLRITVEDHPGAVDAATQPPLVCVDVLGRELDLVLYGARGQARYAEQVLGVRLVVRAAGRPLPA